MPPTTWRGRIIPAYAGSTNPTPMTRSRRPDHPRIRGEHHGTEFLEDRHDRIIPAYAGSTSKVRAARPADRGSSPHTRGARAPETAPRGRRRIIPAYAGSTSPGTVSAAPVTDHPRIRGSTRVRSISSWQASDHPRIRGEHVKSEVRSLGDIGSSPHTRGALHDRVGSQAWPGIIPAYAGSTCR